jgi:glycosyltransferase involved in cell wall biosynthesis
MDNIIESQKISCIVHTCNSEATLAKCLKSIAWVDELLVVDMESDDLSVEIARQWGATVLTTSKVPRVDGIRNIFVEKACGPWILVIDSDEYLADDGEKLIRTLISEDEQQVDAFGLPRFNYIAGQVMMGSGWYPDHQIRLFKKGTIIWEDTNHTPPHPVSQTIKVKYLLPPGCLHIHHINYNNLKHFIQKQLNYALNDNYDSDLNNYNFQDYLAESYEVYAQIYDPLKDGDLSRALALIMAWNSIVKGLIHWEKLDRRPNLGDAFCLPLSTVQVPINLSKEASTFNSNRLKAINKASRLHRYKKSSLWTVMKNLDTYFIQNINAHSFMGRLYQKFRNWLKKRLPL